MKHTVTMILLCVLVGHAQAEQKVNFSDESVIKKVLMDNRWVCGVGDDSGWGGQSEWIFVRSRGQECKG